MHPFLFIDVMTSKLHVDLPQTFTCLDIFVQVLHAHLMSFITDSN